MTFVAMEGICSMGLMENYVAEVRVFYDDQGVMTYQISVQVRRKVTGVVALENEICGV